MPNICENCMYKSKAIEFDKNFRPIGFYCKAYKTWMTLEISGCDAYEPNLHDDSAAPNNTQARNNGIHQE